MSLCLKETSEGNGKTLSMGEGVKGCRGEDNPKVNLQEKIRLSVGSGKMGMENQENREQRKC
jgi:hypothetical protein